jgi:DNA anti-recombination protein RmuC
VEFLSPIALILLFSVALLLVGWFFLSRFEPFCEILRAPKLRGGLGEFFVEDLLAQILSTDHFATQHAFRSSERVDVVIKLGGSLRGHFGKFGDDFGLLGKHLSHAQSSYQSTERRLEQFGQRLLSADANQEFVEFRSYDRKMG